ncbi:MAG: hypothetical protein GY705_31210 [Bacteroidetes bacterium]|nr:hypothetical protein [Bacteroidota bacterium]
MPEIILKNFDFVALTCINSRKSIVCDDIKDLLSKHKFRQKILKMTPQNSSIKLPAQPYSEKQGFILWEPKNMPGRCAFMATLSDGWATLIHNMGMTYKHECLKIRISKATVLYPICELLYYKSGTERRFIRSMKDEPRWEFYQKGKPLSFEKVDNYNKRRIKDRFTEELLLEYLLSIGWNLREELFWQTEKPYYKM